MEQREGVRRSIPASFDVLSGDDQAIALGATSATTRVSGDWYRIMFDGAASVPDDATWEINGESVEMGWVKFANMPSGFTLDAIVTSIVLDDGTIIAYKD